MAQIPKKFGTFAGVFTPSILTILGVIMYMRLGWVVGEAGIIGAVGVILIAHIISITTGLSISSISTDKKIQGGGIYYVLSRSLGLPMGGAIGIALFIGTALSISLYIIGFGENFLGIESIREFLGLTADVAGYRILGTAVILVLVIIALISTSFALKAQFVILGAILLSLISVILGFFLNNDLAPESANLLAASEGVPLEVVFAIFFPAVTGFTAGVAMSGDLKDPRKSIPRGTMASIIVGLVVYLALAVSFGVFVDRDLMLSDNNFLMKIAWFAPLVIAGIWGATLSSALGGILGGPRILQAMSSDKITPRIFSKGSGVNNEPRNALILTFLIAEGGILIGELDVIARLVSMFYIAAYGFINLAFALEKWASADFRPDFKVSKWIGIIGFIASFAVMFKLDTMAMVLAFIAIGGIYFLLQRKQMRLEFGDVWQSVKTNIVRKTLHDLNKGEIEERNWRPNIILFSGSLTARPHLIDFGKSIVGRHGFVSVFEIIENKNSSIILPRHKQSVMTDESLRHEGVYTRKFVHHDLYEAIETISGTYGFSGIEPNTVLMGWAKQKKDPKRFVNMLSRLDQLDMNIVMIDYDKRFGFGNKQLIDIWWRKSEPNGIFSLILARYLMLSENWRNASIRLLIILDNREEREIIFQNTQQIISDLRLQAEIRIIENESAQKSIYEIIRIESANTDLVMLGISDIEEGKEQNFIETTNGLCEDIGTVVLLKASSYFKTLHIGYREFGIKGNASEISIFSSDNVPEIKMESKPIVASQLNKFADGLNRIAGKYLEDSMQKSIMASNSLTNKSQEIIENGFKSTLLRVNEGLARNSRITTTFILQNMIVNLRKLLRDYRDQTLQIQKTKLSAGISNYLTQIQDLAKKTPEHLFQYLNKDDLAPDIEDQGSLKSFKTLKRIGLLFGKKQITYKIKYHKLVASYIPFETLNGQLELFRKLENFNFHYIINFEQLLDTLTSSFERIELSIRSGEITDEIIEEEKNTIEQKIKNLEALEKEFGDSSSGFLMTETSRIINLMAQDLDHLNANHLIKKKKTNTRISSGLNKTLLGKPDLWLHNQQLFFNELIVKLQLASIRNVLKNSLNEVSSEIIKITKQIVDEEKNLLQNNILDFLDPYIEKKAFDFDFSTNTDKISQLFRLIPENAIRKISTGVGKLTDFISLIEEESLKNYQLGKDDYLKSVDTSVRLTIDYLVQNDILTRARAMISKVETDITIIYAKLKDVNRIVKITQQFTEEEEEDVLISSLSYTEKKSIIIEQIEILKALTARIDEINDFCENKIYDLINEVENKINIQILKKFAGTRKIQRKKDPSATRRFLFKSNRQKFKKGVSNLANHFWYSQSMGSIFAKRLWSLENKTINKIDTIHNLLDQITIQPQVLKTLPFYYQQLFLRKQSYLNEFRVDRKRESLQAEKTIRRYQAGYAGAMMIFGEENSGKTFFSNYLIDTHFKNSTIYRLHPHPGGSIDPLTFKEYLQRTTGLRGDIDEIFSQIPDQSVMMINNFELWWEKSQKGLAVIELIINMINKYSDKCFFIVNANTRSFSFINKIYNIESSFLSFIELDPMNAEQLKDLVMKRHMSGTLRFQLGLRSEEKFQSFDYARLFSKYYNITRGNPGLTLSTWIANITNVDEQVITIKTPRSPNLESLDNIENDWNVLILQFILHKRLTEKRLQRITKKNTEDIAQKINALLRTGILVEYTEGVYEINESLYTYLQEHLIQKEML